MKRFAAILLVSAGLCFPGLGLPEAAAQATATPPVVNPANASPKYVAAMAEAKVLLAERQYIFAANAYKKANKIAGGRDSDSLKKLFDLQIKMGETKDAASTAGMLQAAAAYAG